MSTYDYRALKDNPHKLLPCQTSNKVFLSETFKPYGENFGLKQPFLNHIENTEFDILLTNTSPVQVSRLRFVVDIISSESVTLYEGTRFSFGGDQIYYLAKQINLVANVVAISVPMQTRANSLATTGQGKLRYIYPYFGVNSVVESESSEVLTDNVFSGGLGMKQSLVGTNISYELTGPRVENDSGYDRLFGCKMTGDLIGVQLVSHFSEPEEFTAIVPSMDRIIERGEFFKIKCMLVKVA